MKIVLFTDALGAGGAQRQLVGLAKLLREASYDVSVMTYHDKRFYVPQLEENGIPYIFVKKAQKKFLRIIAISHAIRKINPNVVIAYQSSPAMIASVARLFNPSVRFIVSERNTSQRYTGSERLRFNLYRLVDEVVPNSYSQGEFIKKNASFLNKKIHVIPNFVDTDFFKPARLERDAPRLLTVARITKQKNILKYLEAIKLVADKGYKFKVDWFGYADGGGIYHNECIRKIKELQLEAIFTFHAPSSSIKDEYNNCDALCLPSIYEGTPNVVCEAMSCGTPILCSDVCDNSRIVHDSKNGFLFNPNSVEDMAASLIRFLELDRNTINHMGQKSREMAIDLFSKEKFLNEYIKLITSKSL